MITFEEIKNNKELKSYIKRADDALGALGYTDHSSAHSIKVASIASKILFEFGFDEHTIELTKIASYIHDIGNMVNRVNHAQSGAVIAFNILSRLEMNCDDIAVIIGAIGNHDEDSGIPISVVSAALIIGDKTDVRRSRVRNTDFTTFDVHDRVNYSVKKSDVLINKENKDIILKMEIDTEICSVMEYFEIFLTRMVMCKRAANYLDANFGLYVNEIKLL